MSGTVLNESTDYVHTHVVNFEPTYLVLSEVVELYRGGDYEDMAALRDAIAEAVDDHWPDMGLRASDLDDEVDYAAMIEFEAGA